MSLENAWTRFATRLSITPIVAVGIAVALLAASVGLAVQNEYIGKLERIHQATVQAQILAGSLAAPLAFNDNDAALQYVNALRANPDVKAVGAYDVHGRLAVGYAIDGQEPPQVNALAQPVTHDSTLVVTARVDEGATTLGSVYLRVAIETWQRRLLRYLGIAIVLLMASLLVAVLGISYASVRSAHEKLQEEIEERRKVEETLRHAQKMEAMGQLTGGIAHDFNNLLMVASSGLELLDRTDDPVRRARLKDGVRAAIDRGAKLTQQLLAFARRSSMHPEVIDLDDRFTGLRELLERSLREDILVDLSSEAGLWPVEVDPSQLEVAILNIALNARDAMPNGGVLEVYAENRPADGGGQDLVRISITDSGAGIAPDMLSKIFEPFFTTKGAGQGTGLGLSQVYGFAQASGGEVTVESVVNQGTTISLLLPRSTKTPAAKPEPKPVPDGPPIGGQRILLVEDDDSVAELVGDMLHRLGYVAVREANAAAALNTLSTRDFDLVFSDMIMPGDMNGLELAREIARRRPDLPIILTTGYSPAATAATQEGLRLLVKPYRMEDLANELRRVLAA
jgi:signal transduction histidine kinase